MSEQIKKHPSQRRMNLEDRKEIERLLKEKFNFQAISERLQTFTRQSISREVARNGSRDNYNAEKAHAKTLLFRRRACPIKNMIALTADIESLKMQIEILTDTVTKLMEKHEKK